MTRIRTFAAIVAAVALVAMSAVSNSWAATSTDTQANQPQVAGDPSSGTTARFPTNKQNEPSIAVNPRNSQLLIAGSNDEQEQPPCGPGPVRGADAKPNDCSFYPGVGTSGVYTSNDGGTTWVNRGLLDDQPGWQASNLISGGDPVIVYGPKPDGHGGFTYGNGARAYYASLAAFKTSPYGNADHGAGALAISWSDDDGATWSAPVVASTKRNPNDFNDKESMWVDKDPNSPYFGRAYVSWTEFRSPYGVAEPVDVTYSTDGGRTWSAPKSLTAAQNTSSLGGRQGSQVRSGPDGSVYVAWVERSSQYVAISRDGGRSFSKARVIGPASRYDDPIPGSNFRMDDFLAFAVDPRANATSLYAAWTYNASGADDGGRIVFSKSVDKGLTWSAPVVVSTPAEGYAFFPGMDVAPNGRVDLGYQGLKADDTSTFGTGNAWIDSYYLSLPAGGAWSAPMKVTTVPSDPAASAQNNLQRQFWGDYNTLVSSADRAWFIYTDSRSGAGCPAVDAYQHDQLDRGLVTEQSSEDSPMRADEDAMEHGKPADSTGDEPVAKPAPQTDCPPQFGNTDVFVSTITP
jgi:hypothetical protein